MMKTYEDGYKAFSNDKDGTVYKMVEDCFSGKEMADLSIYGDDWFYGYQDAKDDFNNSQMWS